MRDMIINCIISILLGAALATQYWLQAIPADYMQLYERQSEIIGKCLNIIN